ncbi:MAG: hypothetical protein CMN77_04385 [Spirochaetaceae bacterium]|nr:hypothetical protein [Spirochaetaceae bacterium]
MSSREKFIIMALILGGFLFVHVRLASSATNHDYLEAFQTPRAFSQYSLILGDVYPGLKPENAFDRNPNTCFREPVTRNLESAALPNKIQEDSVPKYSRPTLSGELGLSHQAGQPPQPEDFSFVQIQFCNTEKSVKPRAVRVQLFRQKLYDVDRQYRVPDAPELWHSVDLNLSGQSTERFPLELEPFSVSSGFPDSFFNVWVRLIFSVPQSAGSDGATEICIQDIQVGNRAFFPASENGDGTCP